MAAIGIDLGTGTTSAAVFKNGKVEHIPNQEGEMLTPSFIAWANNEWLVGTPAQRQAITNPANTVYVAKRFMGMDFSEVGEAKQKVPYTIKADNAGRAVFEVAGKNLTPEEVGAKILQKIKRSAEDFLGESVDEVVITTPAYYSQKRRESVSAAATIAGFKKVLRIINEPTASVLAFGADKKKEQKILIFDLGSGTCDTTIAESSEEICQVLGTAGRHYLGGSDFDAALVDYIAATFKAEHGVDLRQDKIALQRLRTEAEKAKKELSTQPETELNMPFITADATGPKHLLMKITRAKFEALIEKYVDEAMSCIKDVLKDAKLEPSQIDDVVFVGGSSRIPVFAERVKKMFGKEPNRSVNPDLAVSAGAAIQAGLLSGTNKSDLLLLDVTSLSLGLRTLGDVATVLIPRNTTIPVKKSQIFSTAKNNQSSVTIETCQGERSMFNDNQALGSFNLDDIPNAPRGTPQISVEFDINASGIVTVTATDLATKKTKNITIKSGLSPDEIQRMIKDAEANEAADKRKAELVQKFNQLDGMILSTRKMLEDSADKLTAHKDELETALKTAQDVLDARDEAKLDSELASLEKACHKAAETLYAQQATSGPAEATVEPE